MMVINDEDKIITNKDEKVTTWREYLNKLFGEDKLFEAASNNDDDLS